MLAGSDGYTIGSEAEARRFDAAMRAHAASWTPRDLDPQPIRRGDTLLLEPCVGPDYEARFGQRCPRVELWPENAAAAQLIFAALPAHTRPLLPAVVDAITAELEPSEARRTVLDALDVLQGPTVNDWMRAQLAAPVDED